MKNKEKQIKVSKSKFKVGDTVYFFEDDYSNSLKIFHDKVIKVDFEIIEGKTYYIYFLENEFYKPGRSFFDSRSEFELFKNKKLAVNKRIKCLEKRIKWKEKEYLHDAKRDKSELGKLNKILETLK